jgi:spore germination protein GerM
MEQRSRLLTLNPTLPSRGNPSRETAPRGGFALLQNRYEAVARALPNADRIHGGKAKRDPVKSLLALTALVIAAGTVGYFLVGWGSDKAVSLGPPSRQTTSTQAAQLTGNLPSGRALDIWFARGGRLVEALRTHTATPRVATAALDALLAGPTRAERAAGLRSEIPRGTRLLGVSIANGIARVDLTSDYEAGAGSRSLQLRLAQVVYTLTQFATVTRVRFALDGTPVNVFSGSGIVLDHPVGRSAYKGLAPVASPLAGSWRLLPSAPIPAAAARASVWTGRELLVLGRVHGALVFAAYSPGARAWHRLAPPRGAAPGRYRAVWTGKQMLVWGRLAYAYTPASGRWRRLPRSPVASAATVTWTGRELVGWSRSGGAAYRPATGRWRALPPAPFLGASAWTGRELIAVSGSLAAAYRPADGWRALPQLPEARQGASAVWDGHELLVIGGDDAPAIGLAYDPRANSWHRLAPMDSGRARSAVVWTGRRLLLWGGETGSPGAFGTPPHGLAYDPRADRWSPLPQAPLQGRLDPVAAWTGRSLIVWGGDAGFGDGAAFTPR